MASIPTPCPKCSAASPRSSRNRSLRHSAISLPSTKLSFLAGSARIPRLRGHRQVQFPVLKAQVREAAEGSSSSPGLSSAALESLSSGGKDPKVVEDAAHQSALSESTISAFMTEVSDIVKLVDSRDIVELKLKQMDCELLIRKKEAFAQSSPAAPVVMMQPPQQPMFPPQLPMSQPTPAASPLSAAATLTPLPSKGSKSSLPPLKCPMAGTLYRSPAPGEPPFVKVGDKVQKGQVVCIIEAMKLMNEIEADQSGTIVEILAEDGKPISVDMPLLVIQP